MRYGIGDLVRCTCPACGDHVLEITSGPINDNYDAKDDQGQPYFLHGKYLQLVQAEEAEIPL